MKNLETYHFTFCPLFFSQIHENQNKSNFVFILSKVHVTKKKNKQTKQKTSPVT